MKVALIVASSLLAIVGFQNCSNLFFNSSFVTEKDFPEPPPKTLKLVANVRSRLGDQDWETIANSYDMVGTLFAPAQGLEEENARIGWVKKINPKIKAIVYGSGLNCANFKLQCWGGTPQAGYESWFMKDVSGQWVEDWEFPGALAPDPGNEEWQNYVGQQYKNYIDTYGYDGVFVDLVTLTTHYVNYQKPESQWAINPRTGILWTNLEWRDAMLKMLRVIRSYIGDKLMFVNGAADYENDRYWEVFDFGADGVMNEGFTGFGLTAPWGSSGYPNKWELDVKALADIMARGKMAIMVPNVKESDADWYKDPGNQELFRFLTASYLIGMGPGAYLFYKVKAGNGEVDHYSAVLPDASSTDIGAPLATFSQEVAPEGANIFKREFANGLVLVNPSKKAATISFTGLWNSEAGASVNSPIVLQPGTAVILYRSL